MQSSHAIPELDAGGLRRFGLVTGGIVAGLFGLFFPWLLGHSWPLWPWVLFGVLGGVGLLAPAALRPVYKGWMRFGLIANRITTPVVLSLVFFIVIAPISIARRILGRDSMKRNFSKDAPSYRVPSERRSRDNLRNPF